MLKYFLLVTIVTTISIILNCSVSATASKLTLDLFETNGTLDDVDIIVEIVNNTYANVNVTVKESITSRVLINGLISSDSDDNTKVITKFTNFDYCRMIRNFGGGVALKILYQSMRQKSFITSCPIQKGFYYLKHYRIDPDTVPFRFVPAGKYLFSTTLVFTPRSNINTVLQSINFVLHITLQRF